MKTRVLLLFLMLTSASCTTRYYLVRHAERLDGSSDSPLSEAGHARARALRDTLLDKDIHRIFASIYVRTQQTARPLADTLNVPITIYHPDTTAGLLEHLQRISGESVLVVGHSDNVPQLVYGLCGETVSIAPDDYDNLFVITVRKTTRTKRTLQRLTYGFPSP
ncbi:MAG: phosphoglycerate mutase family protein [Saprospiraceae bacterium]|nr:histidine phosphatase family protein [Saprospiraceae bacterium]MDW8228560.1 phosphoglycerate mutase family protein [Saprospiraceae bacterium]